MAVEPSTSALAAAAAAPDGAASERAEGASARPKVVYVMGAGRSGSTIFGIALGNCAGVFYAGELDAWLVRSGVPQLDDLPRMRFWSEVREGVGEDAAALFGNRAQRHVERSLALLRVHRWPSRRRLRRRYLRVAEQLYRSTARAAGVGCVVDSSHYPLRARELQRSRSIDLCLVYLVRDPRSVVASFGRRDVAQYSKAPLTTNAYLWLTNLLAVPVFLRHPRDRRLLVRYERFVADPHAVLGDVIGRFGIESQPPDLSALSTGVPFQGNRVIRSRTVALEPRAGQAPPPAPLTAVVQAPWRLIHSLLGPAAGGGTEPGAGGSARTGARRFGGGAAERLRRG